MQAENSPQTYVLVHGAWQAQFVWKDVKEQLQANGSNVLTVELPGHGTDDTPVSAITLGSYRDAVITVIQSQPNPVILVGHSLAGMIISVTAESIPEQIEKLVYIAAYLPKNGDSLSTLSQQDTESQTAANLDFAPDYSTATVKTDVVGELFCTDGTNEQKQRLADTQKPEPLAPFQAAVSLSDEKFGRIPLYYVKTLQDRVIGPKLQDWMIAQNGHVRQVYSIDSGHSPFISKPAAVVEILTGIS
jgi:pimeloyl-ACP methyl ester carboxylesterase